MRCYTEGYYFFAFTFLTLRETPPFEGKHESLICQDSQPLDITEFGKFIVF